MVGREYPAPKPSSGYLTNLFKFLVFIILLKKKKKKIENFSKVGEVENFLRLEIWQIISMGVGARVGVNH